MSRDLAPGEVLHFTVWMGPACGEPDPDAATSGDPDSVTCSACTALMLTPTTAAQEAATMSNPFTVGQRVEIAGLNGTNETPYDIPVGSEAIVASVLGNTIVHLDRAIVGASGTLGEGQALNVKWLKAAEGNTQGRPLIDFSAKRYDTLRGYADDLMSRANKADSNAVLHAVENGEQVDAYALAAILPDVLSGCATRRERSGERREMTRKARALAHVAHAVLANHADGLPVYAEGDRSRAVEAAKMALAEARQELDATAAALQVEREKVTANVDSAMSLQHDVEALQERVLAAEERLGIERGTVASLRNRLAEAEEGARQARISKQEANRERDTAEEAARQARLERDAIEQERDALAQRAEEWEQRAVVAADHNDEDSDLLTYALGMLTETQRARYEGFKDAVRR